MTKRILIDAVHPEEIRVAMEQDGRLEEFDFESESKRQIKSNVYLGKVTRVEPSLQAVFVEYGGNRQGFLPFSEIHYDYYQIPVADRERLEEELAELEKQAEAAEQARAKAEEEREANQSARKGSRSADDEDAEWDEDNDDDTPAMPASKKDDEASTTVKLDEEGQPKRKPGRPKKSESEKKADAEAKKTETDEKPKRKPGRPKKSEPEKKTDEAKQPTEDKLTSDKPAEDQEPEAQKPANAQSASAGNKHKTNAPKSKAKRASSRKPKHQEQTPSTAPDTPDDFEPDEGDPAIVEEAVEARHIGRSGLYRNYKVQEVIKRGQLVLVQVIKEERGSKGASLTTYVSLAGRYCVLMPNTERAGGVSRRIQDYGERKRLKTIINDLEMPKGASLIVRTAGIGQNQKAINRDYNYLMKLWDGIKQSAVTSEAPELVHEEGNIIKRVLRDMYRDDVETIYVQGEKTYDIAQKFLRIMAPDEMKKLAEYKDSEPIFKHFGISEELEQLYHNEAPLPSGGSIVIVQTEALVAIDVNSGKSTGERSIESTALNTNLEAAKEIARQLRLRDLAGLVVIDFIDMREMKNRRAVEKGLKEALREDRAKIQVGRISIFGLMEMSRQRLRSSIVESSTRVCPSCSGTGYIRSEQSIALSILRAAENEAAWGTQDEITIRVPVDMALHLLNAARDDLSKIEERFGVSVTIKHDFSMNGTDFEVEKPRGRRRDRKNDRKRSGNDNRKQSDKKNRDNTNRSYKNKNDASQKHENKNSKDATPKGNTSSQNKQPDTKSVEQPEKKAKPVQRPEEKTSETSDTTVANDSQSQREASKKPTSASSNQAAKHTPEEVLAADEEPHFEQDDSKLKGLWRRITQ